MANPTFFRIPFALSGTKTAVPEDTQPDGAVNYTDGYTADYALPLSSDPDARPVERAKWNQLMYSITSAIRALQVAGAPAFIEAGDNDGSPYSYNINALVLWTDGAVYQSLANTNTADPTDATKWKNVSAFFINPLPTTNDSAALGSATFSWADLFLASGGVINFANGDVTLTHGANLLTIAGGDLALGTNNLLLTGSIGATGERVLKGWFTDIESTNAPIINGTGTAVNTDPTGVTGADKVLNVMSLTTAEYTAIGAPVATTLYIITDA